MTGLIGTSVAWTHEIHYGYFPSPEVMLIYMPLDPLFQSLHRGQYLGLNLPFFPNLITFFQGDTFKNTLSLISYRISFLFMSAYDFCLSVATFNLSLIIFTFSSVSYIKSGSITFFSLNSVQHNGVLHFLPIKPHKAPFQYLIGNCCCTQIQLKQCVDPNYPQGRSHNSLTYLPESGSLS